MVNRLILPSLFLTTSTLAIHPYYEQFRENSRYLANCDVSTLNCGMACHFCATLMFKPQLEDCFDGYLGTNRGCLVDVAAVYDIEVLSWSHLLPNATYDMTSIVLVPKSSAENADLDLSLELTFDVNTVGEENDWATSGWTVPSTLTFDIMRMSHPPVPDPMAPCTSNLEVADTLLGFEATVSTPVAKSTPAPLPNPPFSKVPGVAEVTVKLPTYFINPQLIGSEDPICLNFLWKNKDLVSEVLVTKVSTTVIENFWKLSGGGLGGNSEVFPREGPLPTLKCDECIAAGGAYSEGEQVDKYHPHFGPYSGTYPYTAPSHCSASAEVAYGTIYSDCSQLPSDSP
eukprot:Protomagalhaensia_wolfi_Nauph_80__4232@NODE_430_length_2536_cov_279_809772_g323_i0_p1_GENE_NODE_430_length_2536_cov_279_809772_g323_i0NODE_430_length_2536_cov_279_809772_g323_i0_p1_ORF_typecomplete_len343_score43_62_NODE_430_length_2536_cov_279_809772_g323_i013822410